MKQIKLLSIIISFLFASQVFALAAEYKFENMDIVDDFDFSAQVEMNQDWSIVVFNSGYCPLPDSQMDCFPFEMKFDYLAPQIFGRNGNIRIFNMDTDNTYTYRRYGINKRLTVLFFLDGQIMETLNGSSTNDLLEKTLNTIYKISQ